MDSFDAFIIGYLAGIATTYFIVRAAIRTMVKKLEEEFAKETTENVTEAIRTRVEVENGIFYVYEVDNGQFVAQGSTLAELKAHCSERFKNDCDIAIVSGQKEAIETLKAQLKELNENRSSV